MATSSCFTFRASEVFGILGRGLVFCGEVNQGVVRVGHLVKLAGKDRMHCARVVAIWIDGNLVDQSVHGPEVRLMLSEFDDPGVCSTVSLSLDSDEASSLPNPEALLSIELPVDIFANKA